MQALGRQRHRGTSTRLAIVGSPRSGNMWLRRLLMRLFELEECSAHTPAEVDWTRLADSCVLQIHWPPTRAFVRLLRRHSFKPVVLVRNPLDSLISILHFAGHEPQTARWLDGAHGDERQIGAEPCSAAFLAYASSIRAQKLLAISPQWWNRSGTARMRYEDLVVRPAEQLERLASQTGIVPLAPIDDVIEAVTFDRLRREATNHHFWQGQPGLWRKLLPAEYVLPAATSYASHARRFGYDMTPDPALTLEQARDAWRRLVTPPAGGLPERAPAAQSSYRGGRRAPGSAAGPTRRGTS